MRDREVIVAIATPPGRGGIGIVRLAGRELTPWIDAIVDKTLMPRHATRATFLDADGSTIDDGIALLFDAPHSYTGDDVLELHGHGGPAVLRTLVQRCIALGARLAEPGEFTRRAFLNDKLDLAQAEAVADLIDADTAAAAKAAMRSLSGVFSHEVRAVVDGLIHLRMFTEATLDFPDEDVEFIEAERAGDQLTGLRERLESILQRARNGQMLREGLQIVLIGRPNVGKSSLLNRLAREDVAIVTPIAGTTRDTVRQQIEIGGVALHLIDTAGVRRYSDAEVVERLGIERTWDAAKRADCALVVIDDAAGWTAADADIARNLPEDVSTLIVHNKIDLSGASPAIREGTVTHIYLSAKTGAGIELLERAILDAAGWQATVPAQFLARERHVIALRASLTHLVAAAPFLQQQPPALELFAEELRLAQQDLSAITGEFTPDDLLGEIFSRFCIGK